MTARLTGEECRELVSQAASGDSAAWERIVDAYVGLIWAIARNHRLSFTDAADVSQTTWLRLIEHIDRIDDPSRVGAWLATTARRECLRVLGRSHRLVLVGDSDVMGDMMVADEPELDAGLIASEEQAEVRAALDELPPRCRELLDLLMLDPAPSYEEISAALGMPIGSIGPTRGRCLKRLRRSLIGSDHDEGALVGIAGLSSSLLDGENR
jgi:RNA polymerase sigma factor (sigma-70 family)